MFWNLDLKVQTKTDCKFRSWSVGLEIVTENNIDRVFWYLVFFVYVLEVLEIEPRTLYMQDTLELHLQILDVYRGVSS